MVQLPIFGHFAIPGLTQSAGTAIFRGIPPYPGPSGAAPFVYTYSTNKGANWLTAGGGSGAFTMITRMSYVQGSTAHTHTILRPKNFTTVNGAVAKNTTVVNVTADPGLYATNYLYPCAASVPGNVADNAIAAGDYVAVQLANGTWLFDKVASVSTLAITLTTGTPNVTGGTIADQAPFFFFGVLTDVDPATFMIDPQWVGTASVTEVEQDNVAGLVTNLRPGDPMIYHNANATAASTLQLISGLYVKL